MSVGFNSGITHEVQESFQATENNKRDFGSFKQEADSQIVESEKIKRVKSQVLENQEEVDLSLRAHSSTQPEEQGKLPSMHLVEGGKPEEKGVLKEKKLDSVAKKIKQKMMLMNLMQAATDNALKGICMECSQKIQESKSMVSQAMKVGEENPEAEEETQDVQEESSSQIEEAVEQDGDSQKLEDDASVSSQLTLEEGLDEVEGTVDVEGEDNTEAKQQLEQQLYQALSAMLGRLKSKTKEEAKLDELEQMVYQQMLFTDLAIDGISKFVDKNCKSCESKERHRKVKPDDSLYHLYT